MSNTFCLFNNITHRKRAGKKSIPYQSQMLRLHFQAPWAYTTLTSQITLMHSLMEGINYGQWRLQGIISALQQNLLKLFLLFNIQRCCLVVDLQNWSKYRKIITYFIVCTIYISIFQHQLFVLLYPIMFSIFFILLTG